MKNNLYTLLYAGILGSVCAFFLTGAAIFTRPYQRANAEAEKKRNILEVLHVPFDHSLSSKKLLKVFQSKVKDESSDNLEAYRYVPKQGEQGDETVAVAFDGPGLWGPIEGFLALKPDMRTIRGVTFYKQEETPGLGGEIASKSFRQQFVGKSIVSDKGKAGMIISRDGISAVNGVDAITGATMTCDKVQAMLNNVIERVVKENRPNER